MQQYVMCKFTLKLKIIDLVAIGKFEGTKRAIPQKEYICGCNYRCVL